MAAWTGIAPATFRSTGGCSSWLSDQARKGCGVRAMLPDWSEDSGFTGQLASLANYRRVKWWTATALHRALPRAKRVTS